LNIAILGSGPNAYAAYLALENSLHQITVIDFGYSELSGQQVLPGLASKDHKYSHNSMHLPKTFSVDSHLENGIAGSSALGGWSNVWGATIFPLTELELDSWDLDPSTLLNNKALLRARLATGFSTSFNSDFFFEKGIGRHIYNQSSHKKNTGSILFSDLMIAASASKPEAGCVRCGKCLTGCPWNHIWSSRDAWSREISNSNLSFEYGVWINTISEVDNKVKITGIRNSKIEEFDFDKVIVALGVYQTASLLLRSEVSNFVQIKDSPMFLMPYVLPFFRKTIPTRIGVTLSSAFVSSTFVQVNNKEVNHDFFAQIYGYSDELDSKILTQFKVLRFIPQKIRRFFLSRVGVAMCFFDESFGGRINCTLGDNNEVVIKQDRVLNNAREIKRIAGRELHKVGLYGLALFGRLSPVGLSYHSGASFPHSKEALAENQNFSDYSGRPNGLRRVHIVDISVFPRIGSSPPTFNSMLNSYRIAKNICHE
jgi:hypothetical protein